MFCDLVHACVCGSSVLTPLGPMFFVMNILAGLAQPSVEVSFFVTMADTRRSTCNPGNKVVPQVQDLQKK